MQNIAYSGDDGDLKIVSGKNLGRLVNSQVPFLPLLVDHFFQHIEVKIGSPRISVDDGQHDRIRIYHIFLEDLL